MQIKVLHYSAVSAGHDATVDNRSLRTQRSALGNLGSLLGKRTPAELLRSQQRNLITKMCTLRSVTRDLEEKDWNAASEKGIGKGGRDLLKPWRVTTRLQSLQAILNPSPGKKV